MSVTENPEGTEQAQAIVPGTPEGEEQVSSKNPKTHTQEEVDTAVHKATSAAGRTAKVLEAREQAVTAAEARAAQAQKDKDEAEEEAARDDSEKLTDVRRKHALRDAKAELAKVTQDLEEERTKGKQRDAEKAETGREVTVFEIATKHTVDALKLKELSKFTDGSTEAIEAIAQSMVKKGEQKPPLDLVSSRTTGGGGMPESAKGKIRAGWDEVHK